MSGDQREQDRRTALKVIFGAVSAALAAAVGLPLVRLFFAPTGRQTVRGGQGPHDFGAVSELPVDTPVKRDVVAVQRDAWDRSDPKPVGSVWLIRRDQERVDSFSTICPHLGCPTNFDAAGGVFSCPCHESGFSLETGEVLWGPAPRGLDPLPVEVEGDGTVRVTYQRFIIGITSRKKVG